MVKLMLMMSYDLLACEEVVIPIKVQNYITVQGLPFVATELDFPEGYGHESSKCQLQADFNGDGVIDYMAFLFDTRKGKISPILFISANSGYQHHLIRQTFFGPKQIWGRLYLLEAGKHWHWNEQITLSHPGIGFQLFEKPCCRYYWHNGRLIQLENDG